MSLPLTSPRPVPRLGRLPPFMLVLAILSLAAGTWGAVGSLTEILGGVHADRALFISRVRDRQLAFYDRLQTSASAPAAPSPAVAPSPQKVQPVFDPLLRLPRADIEYLSLLLGDALYEQLPVTVPLALLQILLSWLLLTGSLGLLRRQVWALSMWSWACRVNIPFALLSVIVLLFHSRAVRDGIGPKLAAALAKVSGQPVTTELYNVHQMVRMYVGGQAALLALWVLLLGGTALYLQRYVVRVERA
jgi:hypothetical protein